MEHGGAATHPAWDCAYYTNGRPALIAAPSLMLGFERCCACKQPVYTGRVTFGMFGRARAILNTDPPFVCANCTASEAAA